MPGILVLANETIGGEKLLDAIRERAKRDDDPRFHVVVPLTRPRHGNVIYDETVRDSAQVRVNLALAFMREEDIDGTGEVGDQDPLNAALDAIAEHGLSEIIVSTLPDASSNWVRRHLPDALHDETGLPVEHVVVDLEKDGPAVRRGARGRQPDRGQRGARQAARGAQREGARTASSSWSPRTAAWAR